MMGDGDSDSDDESSLDSDEEAEGEDDVRGQGDESGTQRADDHMAEDGETREVSQPRGSGRSKRGNPDAEGTQGEVNGGRGPKRRRGSGEGRPEDDATERLTLKTGSADAGDRVGTVEPADMSKDSGAEGSGERRAKRTRENGGDEKHGEGAGQANGGMAEAVGHEDPGGSTASGESAGDELEMVLLHDLPAGREVRRAAARKSFSAAA